MGAEHENCVERCRSGAVDMWERKKWMDFILWGRMTRRKLKFWHFTYRVPIGDV